MQFTVEIDEEKVAAAIRETTSDAMIQYLLGLSDEDVVKLALLNVKDVIDTLIIHFPRRVDKLVELPTPEPDYHTRQSGDNSWYPGYKE